MHEQVRKKRKKRDYWRMPLIVRPLPAEGTSAEVVGNSTSAVIAVGVSGSPSASNNSEVESVDQEVQSALETANATYFSESEEEVRGTF